MKYMLLLYADPEQGPAEGSPEAEAEMGRWFAFTEEVRGSGAWLGGDALHPTPAATTVRERDGQRSITDGPFAETKEILGGYYLLEVPDLDAAVGWAAKVPNVSYGSVEIRPVVDFS